MKRWKIVAKNVAEMYLAFFGLTLIGLIFGITTLLIYWGIPTDIFMPLLFDASLAFLSTIIPYFITFLCVCGWYVVDLFIFLRLRKKYPSVKFKLNEFLMVRFVCEKTVIYVKGEQFKICKYLLMNVPLSEVNDFESIDQASEFYGKQLESEITPKEIGLSPEEEFKGHCSNLQVWVENNYDTCLLHKNLAFPLLKRLSSVGDPVAKEVLVQEIVERFKSKSTAVQIFLIQGGFLSFLEDDFVDDLFQYIVDKQVFHSLVGYYGRSQNLWSEIKALNSLVQMDSINYTNNMVLANRYLRNSDTKNAILVFRKILMLYPNDEMALFFLAHLYMFERKISKAKKTLGRVKNSENKFAKYRNLNELDSGMYKLLKLRRFDRDNDPHFRVWEDVFEDW